MNNKMIIKEGIKDALPIGIGYFAVAFSLGIAAKNAGLTYYQGFLVSLLNNASAGEYAGFSLIGVNASYFEVAVFTFIANARYLLMSFALANRFDRNTKLRHKLLVAFDITDEIFAISIRRKGHTNPYYHYGAMLFCIPMWSIGTMIGVIAGDFLPINVVSALSVALYGMFIAIIIPAAKKDKIICGIIITSFICSYLASNLPIISTISSGTRVIILTVVIASIAAIMFPYKGDNHES